MFKKIKIQIENIPSENDKALIETEVDVLEGVKNVDVDEKSREVLIEFDDGKISQSKLFETIQELGFSVLEETKEEFPAAREHTYFVKGMHCASCEVLIEKKLSALKEVKSVEASADKGRIFIVYEGERPSADRLNKIFREENYLFFDRPIKTTEKKEGRDFFIIAGAALFLIIGFLLIKNSSFAGLINVTSTSSLPMFFLFGLLAGVSSCAALVGGLILSMSKQWLEMYSEKNSTLGKLQPHLMFNIGRIVSYTLLGGVIGALGNKLQISLTFTSVLIVAVSVMMFFLALQMLGVKAFRKF
ncbi:MAG: cation transporter, partial [bacterium]|nr:cation transporter [bacterium]